jgi:hypothetical protein
MAQRQGPDDEGLAAQQIEEAQLNRDDILAWIQAQEDLMKANQLRRELSRLDRETTPSLAAMPVRVRVPGWTPVLILPADVPQLLRSAWTRENELFFGQTPEASEPPVTLREMRLGAWNAAWRLARPLLRAEAVVIDSQVRQYGYRVTHYAAGVAYAASEAAPSGVGATYQPRVRMYSMAGGRPTDFATWSAMAGFGTPGISITSGWLVAFRLAPEGEAEETTSNRRALRDWLGGSGWIEVGAGVVGEGLSIGAGLLRGDPFWVTATLNLGWSQGVMGGIQGTFPAPTM